MVFCLVPPPLALREFQADVCDSSVTANFDVPGLIAVMKKLNKITMIRSLKVEVTMLNLCNN